MVSSYYAMVSSCLNGEKALVILLLWEKKKKKWLLDQIRSWHGRSNLTVHVRLKRRSSNTCWVRVRLTGHRGLVLPQAQWPPNIYVILYLFHLSFKPVPHYLYYLFIYLLNYLICHAMMLLLFGPLNCMSIQPEGQLWMSKIQAQLGADVDLFIYDPKTTMIM